MHISFIPANNIFSNSGSEDKTTIIIILIIIVHSSEVIYSWHTFQNVAAVSGSKKICISSFPMTDICASFS